MFFMSTEKSASNVSMDGTAEYYRISNGAGISHIARHSSLRGTRTYEHRYII